MTSRTMSIKKAMAKIQAIILAGGKGTRLAPLTDNLPKPLVAVCGKPMIAYVLEHLRAAGIVESRVSAGWTYVDACNEARALIAADRAHP